MTSPIRYVASAAGREGPDAKRPPCGRLRSAAMPELVGRVPIDRFLPDRRRVLNQHRRPERSGDGHTDASDSGADNASERLGHTSAPAAREE